MHLFMTKKNNFLYRLLDLQTHTKVPLDTLVGGPSPWVTPLLYATIFKRLSHSFDFIGAFLSCFGLCYSPFKWSLSTSLGATWHTHHLSDLFLFLLQNYSSEKGTPSHPVSFRYA